MSGLRELKKGEILFREGDASDSMYVIKTGRIAITKAKGSSDVILAELGPGDMLGEMAFFDNKPRSAGAKAITDTTVIALPFKSLHAQFKTFPEWLKAIVKTVNTHLRNANQRIKNLEQANSGEEQFFTPYVLVRLVAILALVAERYGEKDDKGIVVPSGTLRRYTIQVFQQPTNKMQVLLSLLSGQGYATLEDLGEGRQKLTLLKHDQLVDFVDFYTEYLFKEESKRVTVELKELKPLNALLYYSKNLQPNDKGLVRVNLTEMQNNSMRDLGSVIYPHDYDALSRKGLFGEKMSIDGGLALDFNKADLERLYPHWELVHFMLSYSGS